MFVQSFFSPSNFSALLTAKLGALLYPTSVCLSKNKAVCSSKKLVKWNSMWNFICVQYSIYTCIHIHVDLVCKTNLKRVLLSEIFVCFWKTPLPTDFTLLFNEGHPRGTSLVKQRLGLLSSGGGAHLPALSLSSRMNQRTRTTSVL